MSWYLWWIWTKWGNESKQLVTLSENISKVNMLWTSTVWSCHNFNCQDAPKALVELHPWKKDGQIHIHTHLTRNLFVVLHMPVNSFFTKSWLGAFLPGSSRIMLRYMKILWRNRDAVHVTQKPIAFIHSDFGVPGVPLGAALPKFWVSKVSRKLLPMSRRDPKRGNPLDTSQPGQQMSHWTTSCCESLPLLEASRVITLKPGDCCDQVRSHWDPTMSGAGTPKITALEVLNNIKFNFLQRKFGTA